VVLGPPARACRVLDGNLELVDDGGMQDQLIDTFR
jgi:hypothetical protein